MPIPDLTSPEKISEIVDYCLEIAPESLTVLAIIAVVLGIIACFFGYSIFRVLLGIFAGATGSLFSFSFACAAFDKDLPASIIVGVTVGVICVIVFVKLYYMGVFLVGTGLGVFLATTVMKIVSADQIPLVIVITGVIGGLLALVLQKFLIILSTAIFGAFYAVMGVAQLVGQGVDPDKLRESPQSMIDWTEPNTRLIILLACTIVLGVIGILVQYKTASALKRRKELTEQKAPQEEEPPEPAGDEEDY